MGRHDGKNAYGVGRAWEQTSAVRDERMGGYLVFRFRERSQTSNVKRCVGSIRLPTIVLELPLANSPFRRSVGRKIAHLEHPFTPERSYCDRQITLREDSLLALLCKNRRCKYSDGEDADNGRLERLRLDE